MAELVQKLLPNAITKLPEIYNATLETLIMILVAGAISFFYRNFIRGSFSCNKERKYIRK